MVKIYADKKLAIIQRALGPGKSDAPMGSLEWAKWVRGQMVSQYRDKKFACTGVRGYVQLASDKELHKILIRADGEHFESLEEFLSTPRPYGIGMKGGDLEEIRRDAVVELAVTKEPLQPHGGCRNPEGNNQWKSSDDKSLGQIDNDKQDQPKSKGGTSAEYLTRRIARDRPDIHQRMIAGEFSSVRQAAIEAGIVKPRESISVPSRDVAKAAATLRKHCDPEFLRALVEVLQGDSL